MNIYDFFFKSEFDSIKKKKFYKFSICIEHEYFIVEIFGKCPRGNYRNSKQRLSARKIEFYLFLIATFV